MWGVDVQRGVDVQHGVSMYNAVSMFNVSMLNVSMFNVSMFNVVSMYNVVFNVGCRCTMWHRCSMWCQFIHLRRKPQLEAQGVCKVRVFSNFQSISRQSPFSTATPHSRPLRVVLSDSRILVLSDSRPLGFSLFSSSSSSR